MRQLTHQLRCIVIALLASVMLVLAPMQGKMADARWVEWCTAQGVDRVLVQDSTDNKTAPSGNVSSHFEHCALCFFAHLPLFFSALAAFVGLTALWFVYLAQRCICLYRRLRVSWALSRAPPVFSFS